MVDRLWATGQANGLIGLVVIVLLIFLGTALLLVIAVKQNSAAKIRVQFKGLITLEVDKEVDSKSRDAEGSDPESS